MAGRREGIPGDVEPAIAGKKLVGVFADLQEFNEMPELRRIARSDVGGLTEKVLGVLNATHLEVHIQVAVSRVDDDGACYDSYRFEQQMAAVGEIGDDLHRWDVLRILPEVKKLAQKEVRR